MRDVIVAIARTFFLQHNFGRSVIPPSLFSNWVGRELLRYLVCFIRNLFKIFSSILVFSLLFGVLFTYLFEPSRAEASFLSSILGGEVHAATFTPDGLSGVLSGTQSDKNLQTMDLLQANVTSASVLQDKVDKNDKQKDDNSSSGDEIDTGTNVNIISNNAILALTGPMGVSDGNDAVDPSTLETSVYVVRQGDSISQIAEMFGVSANTILWANDMKKGDKIKEGDVLFILPISGLEHTVTKGQTLQGIAKLYKADAGEIADFNGIKEDASLAVGDKLMIPDAIKAEENDKPVKNLSASIAKDKQYYENHPIQNLAGYFINPVPGYRKSQGIHDHNGVDLAISKGTPILASAEGKVTLARSGYNGGFGNLVVISHPNGTETLYAHMSKISTNTGTQVYQGQVIGYVGSTGRSTGPHLHFEVHGARNPGTDGSWKY